MTVRTRYAPSPTGDPHLGNIRTALFDWLLARRYGGQFILRIEDTDQARYVEGGVENLMSALRWLGLDWDEGPDAGGPVGPYVQSQRLHIYREHTEKLLASGHAYHCYCSPERLDEVRKAQQARKEPPRYDRHCREMTASQRSEAGNRGVTPVVRFKTPLTGETRTLDALRGEVVFQNSTLDDFVIMKSDGYPTYHLAAMVDDHLMEITHVFRGEEWLPSAPRHFLIYEAFGWRPPVFAHVSRVLGSDRAKLSKRHGAHSVLEYRDQGYLPDALINFLALLGWSLDDHTEIMDREMLVENFSVERLIPNPAVFNAEKLLWMNGMYIREMSDEVLADEVLPFLERHLGRPADRGLLLRIIPLVKERIKLLSEIVEMSDFFFTAGDLEYDVETLLGKKYAGQPGEAASALSRVVNAIAGLDPRIAETRLGKKYQPGEAASALSRAVDAIAGRDPWTRDGLEAAIRPIAEVLGVKAGDLFGLVRVAVTGKTATPPLFETMEILGRETTLARLRSALGRLSAP